MKFRFFAVMAVTTFALFSGPSLADNFADEIEPYYDIHEQRFDYFDAHKEERMKLDSRRHAYFAPLHEAEENYWARAAGGFGAIDYEAGTFGNNVKDYLEYLNQSDDDFTGADLKPELLGPREDFFDNEIEFMN